MNYWCFLDSFGDRRFFYTADSQLPLILVVHPKREEEVMEVRGGLIVVAIFLLLSFVLVPVAARPIGPTKTQKNPNIIMHDGETVLLTPGGVQNEWRDTETSVFDFFHILNASKMERPRVRTFNLTEIIALMMDSVAALKFENKWGYISQETLLGLLLFMGTQQPEAEAIATMWSDGMYFRFVNVGK